MCPHSQGTGLDSEQNRQESLSSWSSHSSWVGIDNKQNLEVHYVVCYLDVRRTMEKYKVREGGRDSLE